MHPHRGPLHRRLNLLRDQPVLHCGRDQGGDRGRAKRQSHWRRSTPHHHPRLRPCRPDLPDPPARPTPGKIHRSQTRHPTRNASGERDIYAFVVVPSLTDVSDEEIVVEHRDQGVSGRRPPALTYGYGAGYGYEEVLRYRVIILE